MKNYYSVETPFRTYQLSAESMEEAAYKSMRLSFDLGDPWDGRYEIEECKASESPVCFNCMNDDIDEMVFVGENTVRCESCGFTADAEEFMGPWCGLCGVLLEDGEEGFCEDCILELRHLRRRG